MKRKQPQLQYFVPAEFVVAGHDWWDAMHPDVLLALDRYRAALRSEVRINKVKGALGRHAGLMSKSQHNVDRWGHVMAVDCHAPRVSLFEQYRVAFELDMFHGIGIYPDWLPYPGVHVDVRHGYNSKNPAQWGALRQSDGKQVYVGLRGCLEYMARRYDEPGGDPAEAKQIRAYLERMG